MTNRQATPDILDAIMAGPPPVPLQTAPSATPIAITAIVNDGGTQMRAGMNADTVKEYEDALTDADAWPFPPVVVFHDGARYWLADGFHRLNAAHRSGKLQEIPADIKAGTRRDAVLYAAGANASHGLRRTKADMRRSVEMLLLDEEWGKWSNREIARRCNVSEHFVRETKKELGIDTAPQAQYTHPKTGETTTMQTTNIGANRPTPATMLAVWELAATVREVYAQVYGGNPEPYATRDMRTGAQMRAGRFWLLCTQSLPANRFRVSDLVQAINNFAAQVEAKRDQAVVTTTIAPTVAYVVPADAPPPARYTVPEAVADKPLPAWVEDPEIERERTQEERNKRAEREFMTADIPCPNCGPTVAWQLNRSTGSDFALRVDAHCRNCDGRWAWIWSAAKPLTRHPAVSLNGGVTLEQPPTQPEPAPAAVAQTVADVVAVHGEPAPAEPAESTTPVSQRADYESDEWYTPAEYIDAAKAVMGAIDLDPASSEMAQTVVGATAYLTKWDDGLAQTRWIHQRIWLNPPYSNPGPWIEKLVREHQAGPFCTEAIVLCNNATETSWFQLLLERFPVCLPARRLAFWRHDHANVGARQGQAFFYLGPNTARFQEIFSQFGPILRRLS